MVKGRRGNSLAQEGDFPPSYFPHSERGAER
jgi:hypothetical protein